MKNQNLERKIVWSKSLYHHVYYYWPLLELGYIYFKKNLKQMFQNYCKILDIMFPLYDMLSDVGSLELI